MDTLPSNKDQEGCDQEASQASVRWGQHHFSVTFADSLKMWSWDTPEEGNDLEKGMESHFPAKKSEPMSRTIMQVFSREKTSSEVVSLSRTAGFTSTTASLSQLTPSKIYIMKNQLTPAYKLNICG